ncbi:Trm112 family protein [Streptomyces sp. S186]|uniref:Trm112 family protein n=1 Tax=Streptomyces sp. S186 TaxID=3434395 RepID=UPI003F664355
MKADYGLLRILACPIDKGPLVLLASEEALYNPRLRRRYPILDGIPQLLPSSGEQVSEAEHERAVCESREITGAEGGEKEPVVEPVVEPGAGS